MNKYIINYTVHLFGNFSFITLENKIIYGSIQKIFTDLGFMEKPIAQTGVQFGMKNGVSDIPKQIQTYCPAFQNAGNGLQVVFWPNRITFGRYMEKKDDNLGCVKDFFELIKEEIKIIDSKLSLRSKRLSLIIEELFDAETSEIGTFSNKILNTQLKCYEKINSTKEWTLRLVNEETIDSEQFNISTEINRIKLKLNWETNPSDKIRCLFDFNSLPELTADRFTFSESASLIGELVEKYIKVEKEIESLFEGGIQK